jgi:hypothetical protein
LCVFELVGFFADVCDQGGVYGAPAEQSDGLAVAWLAVGVKAFGFWVCAVVGEHVSVGFDADGVPDRLTAGGDGVSAAGLVALVQRSFRHWCGSGV